MHLWGSSLHRPLLTAVTAGAPGTQDKSFTLTLFAHDSTFSAIDAQLATSDFTKTGGVNPVVDLFRKEFPDALKHMGEEALLQSWKENPKDGLITVEVRPAMPLNRHGLGYIEERFRDQLNNDLANFRPAVLAVPLPRQGSSHRGCCPRHGTLLRYVHLPKPSFSLTPLVAVPER